MNEEYRRKKVIYIKSDIRSRERVQWPRKKDSMEDDREHRSFSLKLIGKNVSKKIDMGTSALVRARPALLGRALFIKTHI